MPKTMADAKKLAAKGHELLEQYHAVKDADADKAKTSAKKAGRKAAGKPRAGKAGQE